MLKTAIGLLTLIPIGHAATPSEAAQKAIALVQKAQQVWFTKQDCASCHHQTLPALAFRDAREHGIAVDETLARADAVKAFASLANIDRAVQYTHQIDAALDDGLRLMAAGAAGVRPSLTTAVYARHIAMRQRADGHWGTLDNRPPQSTSFITATAVALRAVQLYHHPSLESDSAARVARARTWLAGQTATVTEERAHQLLGLLWSGAPESDRQRLGAALAGQQRDDGGWNSVNGRPSDAFSTGEALVALHDAAGMAVGDPVWQRGLRFLITTQKPDGSWMVRSRLVGPVPVSPPYFDTGYPTGHDQYISMMGASWAIRALARGAGPAKSVELPPLQEAAPRTESWMETVAFGSSADVKRLLDGGWSATSATAGGTTALMFAMPDAQKARLLLDKGADVNARAKTKFSALLVAAQYPNSGPAIDLLLSQGAQWRLKPGEGAPLFNATVLMAAALAGNPGLIARAVKLGDRVEEKYLMLGLFPFGAAVSPTTSGDVETLKALLDAGLPVDTANEDEVTLLASAVLADRVETARLLIGRGADVNHVDKYRMTPLQLAASVDYGNSAMVELLKKSGAKSGPDALALAKKYGHTNLLQSLGGK